MGKNNERTTGFLPSVTRTKQIPFFILLVFILLLTISPAHAGQQLIDLRQGRVHIQAQGRADKVTIRYSPVYGWNEPMLLIGPTGRLLRNQALGHDAAGCLTVSLDQGPGHYELILKPSYLWQISSSTGKMVYEPPLETTGLRMSFGEHELYFHVPEKTKSFKLFWINHRGYLGSAARIQLFDPKNQLVAEDKMAKVDRKTACRLLGSEKSRCFHGGFNPKIDPVPPQEILINNPISGIWKIDIGTTNLFYADDVGVWLAGIPSFFSQSPEHLYVPSYVRKNIFAEIRIHDKKLTPPILGAVGRFGPKGGERQTLMAGYGVCAEKVFFNHKKQEIKNDNDDPEHLRIKGFDFFHHKSKLWPQPDIFSTLVFFDFADWMQALSKDRKIREWGEWAHIAAVYAVKQRQMQANNMVLQFFNEPNLFMPMDEYILFLINAGTRIKNDPVTKKCPIAAPAISTALSKYDPDTSNFLNRKWIREVLRKADDIVDVVLFNVYGAQELEDTFLYTQLINQVDRIIRDINPDDVIEPIIIGATNRKGGLGQTSLFNDWEGALWWASVLSQVVNTGRVKVINFFGIKDTGIRQKGLFTETWKPKHQAVIQQLFTGVLQGGDLYLTVSDHFGLEAVSVKTGHVISMIIVNKSRFTLETSIRFPFGEIDQVKKMIIYQNGNANTQQVLPEKDTIELPPKTVTLIEFNLKKE